MLFTHNLLATSALVSLLVSCVLARSAYAAALNELQSKGAGELAGNDRDDVYPQESSRMLADLLDFLADYRKAMLQQQQQEEDEVFAPSKRSWNDSGFFVPTSMKRKMFWSPLGGLPASARLGGRPVALRPHLPEDSGSPVFRYGRR
jgi:hypothetical protein